MSSPILAVQVDSAMSILSGRVDDHDDDITAINSDISDIETDITAGQASVTNLTNWTRTRVTNVSFTTQDSFSLAVSFGFTFPAEPVVVTNINSGAAATSRWISRAISVTPTGFSLFVFSSVSGATSTWSAIGVGWTATYRP